MSINITLIFSRHEEGGFCTANALLRIMEYVKPDVIFEELSQALFEEAYVAKKLNNLESVAIRNYISKCEVTHIPVDTFERPENFDRDQDRLNSKITGGTGYEFFQLRGLLDQHHSVVNQYGFPFLNSEENEKTHEKLDVLKQKVLEKLNDKNLYRLARLDKEVIENREDVILDNVYAYSKENVYNNGLMFIGSGHMKSIKQKIEERRKTEEVKINWSYFQDSKTALF